MRFKFLEKQYISRGKHSKKRVMAALCLSVILFAVGTAYWLCANSFVLGPIFTPNAADVQLLKVDNFRFNYGGVANVTLRWYGRDSTTLNIDIISQPPQGYGTDQDITVNRGDIFTVSIPSSHSWCNIYYDNRTAHVFTDGSIEIGEGNIFFTPSS